MNKIYFYPDDIIKDKDGNRYPDYEMDIEEDRITFYTSKVDFVDQRFGEVTVIRCDDFDEDDIISYYEREWVNARQRYRDKEARDWVAQQMQVGRFYDKTRNDFQKMIGISITHSDFPFKQYCKYADQEYTKEFGEIRSV